MCRRCADPADVRAAGPSSVPRLAAYEHRTLTARLRVADAVREPAVLVPLETTITALAERLRGSRRRAAVVVDGGDVVGVVSVDALVAALVERLQRDSPPRLARLLVAVSLSPGAFHGSRAPGAALRLGLEIARQHRASVTLLHVMRRLSPRIVEGLPLGIDADVQRWQLNEARAALGALASRESSIPMRIDVRADAIVPALVGAAEEMASDLIMMGGRPRSALARTLTGCAPCPVLVA